MPGSELRMCVAVSISHVVCISHAVNDTSCTPSRTMSHPDSPHAPSAGSCSCGVRPSDTCPVELTACHLPSETCLCCARPAAWNCTCTSLCPSPLSRVMSQCGCVVRPNDGCLPMSFLSRARRSTLPFIPPLAQSCMAVMAEMTRAITQSCAFSDA